VSPRAPLTTIEAGKETSDHVQTPDSIELPVAGTLPVRIPEGEYEAMCIRTEVNEMFGRKIYLIFRIINGKYKGTELFMACNFPKGEISPRCKYYIQWTLANGAPPSRGQRLSRKVFKHKLFSVLIRDTRRKYSGTNKIMPNSLQYSVVETILERITG